jgi:DNA repair protein RecN (Recombination protein N)
VLRNLHIKNLALIREIDVDFAEGLNIMTGETGAGKSIIIDSIGLALGGRVARDMTRKGEVSLAELVFEVTNPQTIRDLEALDVSASDGVIVISRKIRDGRSICRVNGETRTASDVREMAGFLLDIHGQSEHQKLLRPDVQLDLLDQYGGEEIASAKHLVADKYRRWAQIRKALGGEAVSPEERARRISFLQFEIKEIDDAALKEGEDAELEAAYKKLSHARKIAEAVDEVHDATGYEGPVSAGDLIGRALKKLESVSEYDEDLKDLTDQLAEIDSLLNDFNRQVSDYGDNLSFEGGAFEETEERLNLLNRLKVKYGGTIDRILAYRADKARELENLEDYEENRAKLERDLAAAEEELKEASARLTDLRRDCAGGFAKAVSAQLQDLNFARADFEVALHPLIGYTANGADRADYMIATNPGEEPRVLGKVVSGGELSRIMLGIRTMFADGDPTDTLIFDEIDTGISGRTAQKVAEKLAQAAGRHQVLCITHLPQIAAMADTHYGITKELSASEAITRIESLDEEESISELARMLGGAKITDHTLDSAREMKEMCRHYKMNEL